MATISFLIAVDLLQLIVRSRIFRKFEVNGTLSCLVGFVHGSLAFRAWLLFKQHRSCANAALAQALRFLFIPYLAVLVGTELSPFDLSFAPATIAARWKAVEFLPFTAYYANTCLWSLQDLLKTVILAVPAGLWVGWRLRDQPAIDAIEVSRNHRRHQLWHRFHGWEWLRFGLARHSVSNRFGGGLFRRYWMNRSPSVWRGRFS